MKERCLECSIWGDVLQLVIDSFQSKRVFLSRILSATLIRDSSCCSFTLVIKCMPLRNSSRTGLARYTPCPHRVSPFIFFRELCLFQRFTCHPHFPREHEIEDFTLIVDNQVKLKPEEPSHGDFPRSAKTLKSLVNQYALVRAYTQRGGIHKADTGTSAQQDFLDEKWSAAAGLPFPVPQTVIGHTFGKENAPDACIHILCSNA